jgi:hypothetical protein
VDAILASIEQWPYARFLRTNFYAYPLVNALHILSIGALLTSVGLMHLRLAGFAQSLPADAFVGLLRRVALIAFLTALLSGLSLFSVKPSDYAASPLFLTKLAIISAAVLNFLVFSGLEARVPTGVERPGVLKLLAVLSIALWLGALFCGRMLGFV